MPTIALSQAAVASLRFHVKGRKARVREQDRHACRELVDAGIMEPDGERSRFTEDGGARREEILRAEEERIERERFAPPDASGLSAAAMALLRRIASGERVEVSGVNRPLFRELAAARIVILGHSLIRGAESHYRFTYWGWHRRFQLLAGAKAAA